MIKKFESFEDSLEDLESEVELLMQGLIDSLNLKRLKSEFIPEDDELINGYFYYKVIKGGESIVYYFLIEDPFDTTPSNSDTIKNALNKIKFLHDLIEAISKVTDRLDKFGYKWELINYNGDNQLGLYVYNKTNKPKEIVHLRAFESFSSESNDLVTYINYDKFEDLLSNSEVEEIGDNEVDLIKSIIDSVDPTLIKKTKKTNRFHFDIVKSVASFDTKNGYIIFYKFVDGWWMIESCHQNAKSRKYLTWIVDDFDGIKKWIKEVVVSH